MITNEDVEGYLENIQELEIQMHSTYRELAEGVDDPRLRDELMGLYRDEEKHGNMISSLIDMFKS